MQTSADVYFLILETPSWSLSFFDSPPFPQGPNSVAYHCEHSWFDVHRELGHRAGHSADKIANEATQGGANIPQSDSYID